ncbi:YybH family protein [Mammaliicoccus sp. Dog046]|uniref:YybH family protein n=1 Tax=Mammaliicoccus sp. Dog046 TaxID=3034233 RepID=UPI002B25CB20|nr:nuclear transport factor 2 family protein [Mammaliicoccus sp. Dog046]WQK85604.1 nuclear transport factor 2 family protein [Mammaliicoccus sp. Dog046]
MEEIYHVIDTYKTAAKTKDIDLMLSIYTDDIFIYDAWEKWSESGLDAMKQLVTEWFASLGEESLDLEISNIKVESDTRVGFASYDVKFIRLDTNGQPYKSITNRFTVGLVKDNQWKIKHQHSSIPS